MWQFAESIRGMRDACVALETPVTGGNVSFYNETGDSAIWPTPVIGMLGLLDDHRLRVPTGVPASGAGRLPAGGDLRRARRLGVRRGRARRGGRASSRARPRRGTVAARPAVRSGACRCARERTRLRDGGLAIALAEASIGAGHGFAVTIGSDLPAHVALFSEIRVARGRERRARARGRRCGSSLPAHGVPLARLGETGGPRVVFDGLFEIDVAELREAYETAIPRLLGEAGLSVPASRRHPGASRSTSGTRWWRWTAASVTMRDRQIDGFAEALLAARATR